MAKVAFLLVILAIVQSVYTLRCYTCSSRPDGSNFCNDVAASKIEDKECGMNAGKNPVACLKKVVYDNQMKKENVTRSCVILNEKDAHCKPTMPNTEVKFCETCNDNLCNSGNPVNVGVLSGVASAVAFAAMKYLF